MEKRTEKKKRRALNELLVCWYSLLLPLLVWVSDRASKLQESIVLVSHLIRHVLLSQLALVVHESLS